MLYFSKQQQVVCAHRLDREDCHQKYLPSSFRLNLCCAQEYSCQCHLSQLRLLPVESPHIEWAMNPLTLSLMPRLLYRYLSVQA